MNKASEARILKEARERFREHGFEYSMLDIARDADTSIGCINRRWKSKTSLYANAMGHLPVDSQAGRELLAVLMEFASNRDLLTTSDPSFDIQLAGLFEQAEQAIAAVWPEEAERNPRGAMYCEEADTELLPCPFCGAPPTCILMRGTTDSCTQICCCNESCLVLPTVSVWGGDHASRTKSAADRWNMRGWKSPLHPPKGTAHDPQ